MSDELWVVMSNWRKFQYYDQRRPPWITNHVELLHDDNYMGLTEHQALLLHRLWLTYASARCQLRLNTASLSRHTGLRVMRRDLDALNHAGFLEYLHAPRMQDAGISRARGRIEDVKSKNSYVEPSELKSDDEELFHNDEEQELTWDEKLNAMLREMP